MGRRSPTAPESTPAQLGRAGHSSEQDQQLEAGKLAKHTCSGPQHKQHAVDEQCSFTSARCTYVCPPCSPSTCFEDRQYACRDHAPPHRAHPTRKPRRPHGGIDRWRESAPSSGSIHTSTATDICRIHTTDTSTTTGIYRIHIAKLLPTHNRTCTATS